MASLQTGGVRVFTDTAIDSLESTINSFLSGDGTLNNPRKELIFPPQLIVDGGTFYAFISYRMAISRSN